MIGIVFFVWFGDLCVDVVVVGVGVYVEVVGC